MAAHCVAAQHIICKQPQHQGTWLQPLQNNPTKICGHRVEKHRETTAAAERNLDAATPVRSANAELQKSKDLRAQPLQQRAMNQAPQCDLHTLICKLHQTAHTAAAPRNLDAATCSNSTAVGGTSLPQKAGFHCSKTPSYSDPSAICSHRLAKAERNRTQLPQKGALMPPLQCEFETLSCQTPKTYARIRCSNHL